MAWQVMFELQQLTLLLMAQAADKQLLLQVKQKLDQLHLPSAFAIEDLSLIAKLIAKLQERGREEFKRKDWEQTQEHSKQFSQLQEALSMQLARVVRENNQIRRQVWTAREIAEELRLKIANKMQMKLDRQMKQLDQIRILQQKDHREKQLLNELQQLRYKYNELMELIHNSPHFEREYIKRLLKYKKASQQYPTSNLNQESKIAPLEKANKDKNEPSLNEVSLLRSKVISREEEVLRLQKLVEENNNYVHLRYLQKKQSNRQLLLQEQITHLQEQNQKLQKKLMSIPHYHFKSQQKKQVTNDRQDLVMKKYIEQFDLDKKQSQGEYILERRYANDDRSKSKRIKGEVLQKGISQEDKKKNFGRVKEVKNEYYHNSQIGQQHKNRQKIKSHIDQNQNNQQRPSKQIASNPKPPVSSKKTEMKPSLGPQSPRSPLPNQPSSLKPTKQSAKSPPASIKPNPSKPPKSPRAPPTSKEEKNLISAYERLLEQKDNRIAHLQQELKSSPGRSTKIISTQNINTNNSPSKNVIIKNNRNEYISINNISNSENELKKQKQSFMENEIANAAKERVKLAERVQSLEKERDQQNNSKPKIEEESSEQLQNTYEVLKNKLKQTQNALIVTNEQNISLQRQVNELLLIKNTAILSNPQRTLQIDRNSHEDSNELNIHITFLESEIERLKTQVSNLSNQRQILLARLRELEASLHKQATEMRVFEGRVCYQKPSHSSSLISEIVELQNDSEIDRSK